MLDRALGHTSHRISGTAGRAEVEPLIPSWAWVFYVVGPPFLTVLLDYHVLRDRWDIFPYVLMIFYGHTLTIGGLLHAAYVWLLPPVLPRIETRIGRLALHGIAVVTAVGLGLLVSNRIAVEICDRYLAPIYPRFTDYEGSLYSLYAGLMIASLYIAAIVTVQKLIRDARTVERRAQQAQQHALRAELVGMQARTNPHFLFNSLNALAGLIAEDAARAEEMVERIAGLLRYTLDASQRERVSFERELGAVKDYLGIEEARFGDRLETHIDIAPELLSVQVPPLCLQPLVENAVRHGLGDRPRGRVWVSGRRDGDHARFEVRDDGPGMGHSRHTGTGTSLDDLRERLRLTYGSAESLDVESPPRGGCVVTLRLPWQEQA